MLLYGYPPEGDGSCIGAGGYFLVENVETTGVIDVRSQIYSDYNIQFPLAPSPQILSAVVVPIVFINNYNPQAIKIYGGTPVRAKFGSITLQHENVYGESHFINYLQQLFPSYYALINPAPIGFGNTNPSGVAYEAFANMLYMSFPVPIAARFLAKHRLGMSAFVYDLESTVIATIGCYYFVYTNLGFAGGFDDFIVAL